MSCPPLRLPTAAGLTCPACHCAELRGLPGIDDALHCRRCGAEVLALELPDAPHWQHRLGRPDTPPTALDPDAEGWHWLGLVRLAGGDWMPTALAETAGRCWDALLTAWPEGDRLVVPIRPVLPRRPRT